VPKRVIDFDAMWGSDKLAACAAWAQAEYAWLYGLADASGCFEITNLRVIWGRVAAIRGNLTIERLEQVFLEFQDKGLLFVWEHEGKRYAHWTGSDVPGRLPPPSWRMRLERFAPPVPKQKLAEYMSKFARGRAALAGVGFRGEPPRESLQRKEDCSADRQSDFRFEVSELKEGRGRDGRGVAVQGELKRGLEEGQGQDLGLDWNLNEKWDVGGGDGPGGPGCVSGRSDGANSGEEITENNFCSSNSSANPNSNSQAKANSHSRLKANSNARAGSVANAGPNAYAGSVANSSSNAAPSADLNSPPRSRAQVDSQSWARPNSGGYANSAWREKELAVARELRVGQGPVCGPASVKPEVLERIRRREAARAGSRSP
jgi:hypothetical protein